MNGFPSTNPAAVTWCNWPLMCQRSDLQYF